MTKVTFEDLDPSNLKKLTDEQLESLKDLTDEEIKELGRRYPNKPTQNNYLVLADTRKGAKQLHNTSSWKNLADLIGPMNQKFWKVRTIKSRFIAEKPQAVAKPQDITKAEATGAEGVKKIASAQKLTSLPGGQANAGGGENKEPDNTNENVDVNVDVKGTEQPENTNTENTNNAGPGPNEHQTDEFTETNVNDDEQELKKLAEQNAAAGSQNKTGGNNKRGNNKP